MFSHPTDLLKAYLEKHVIFFLRSGDKYEGTLIGVDEHFNIMVKTTRDELLFFRGENIICMGQ